MEKHVGRKLCGLYRWEWEDRKSGVHKGILLPHLHLVVFDLPFISYNLCRKWWKTIINWNGTISLVGKKVPTSDGASFYIAKYAAKVPDKPILGNYVFLNKGGKHWGAMRIGMIPRFPIVWVREPSDEECQVLFHLACDKCRWIDPHADKGFTLLGKHAKEMLKIMKDMGLTLYDDA
jgi:hypothetical protein